MRRSDKVKKNLEILDYEDKNEDGTPKKKKTPKRRRTSSSRIRRSGGNFMDEKQAKELQKLQWMKDEFIKENKRMVKLIEKQQDKVNEILRKR